MLGDEMKAQVQKMLARVLSAKAIPLGLSRPYYSRKESRRETDSQALNSVTKFDPYPVPVFVTKFDPYPPPVFE
jgi:hypothetical protein